MACQSLCPANVTVVGDSVKVTTAIDYMIAYNNCYMKHFRSSCLPNGGFGLMGWADGTTPAHCINPFKGLTELSPNNKYEGQTSMTMDMYLNGETGGGGSVSTYDGDGQWPIVNCRWVGEDSEWPGHTEMSEDEFLERLGGACHKSARAAGAEWLCSNPGDGINDDDGICPYYLRSEYLTFAEIFSANAENFEGGFGGTPASTHQDRHDFAILAVATAKDVQRQQQDDPKSDDDTERTNAVLAHAEAALACTQMWENVNDGAAVDLAACSCVDSESAVYKGKTCAWIKKTNDPSKMENKCKKSSGLGTVYELCPATCSIVDLGPCHVLN